MATPRPSPPEKLGGCGAAGPAVTGGDTGAVTCAAVGSDDPGQAEHRPRWPRPELLRPAAAQGRAVGQDRACRSHPPVHVAATEVRKGGDGPSRMDRFWGSGDGGQAVRRWRGSGRSRSPLDRLPGADVGAPRPAALNRSAEKGSLRGLTAGGCLEPPLSFSREASPALFVRHRNIFCH